MREAVKPRQILLSKRANVFYLDHVKVLVKDDRVVYLTEEGDIGRFYNIPERNTIFILLGKGSSLTDAAARRLADSNIVVGFVGNGGSPLFSSVDYVFLTPQSEYRPTEYMQAWMRMWLDDAKRLSVAKIFFETRLRLTLKSWSSLSFLKTRNVVLSEPEIGYSLRKAETASDTGHLLSIEAEWAKNLYGKLARGFDLSDFTRIEGQGRRESLSDRANSYLDHGNYIAYGYAASALNVLGISYALPVMHGKTRRGALVFDVADLYKDAFVLPSAFQAATSGERNQDFRDDLIDFFQSKMVLDDIIETIKKVVL